MSQRKKNPAAVFPNYFFFTNAKFGTPNREPNGQAVSANLAAKARDPLGIQNAERAELDSQSEANSALVL